MQEYPFLLQQNNLSFLDENEINGKSFWNDISKRICSGDAPFGTQIENHQLIFKENRLDLFTTSMQEIVSFFQDCVGVRLRFMYFSTWKEIKKKVIKDNIIQEFVNRCKTDLNLNSEQNNFLFSLIHLYLTLKKITSENIILKNGVGDSVFKHTFINEIRGLHFVNGQLYFDPNIISDVKEEDDEDDCISNHDDIIPENEEDEDLVVSDDE